MHNLSVAFFAVLVPLAAACGGGSKADAVGPTDTQVEPVEPTNTSPFKELKLYEDGKHVLTMRKDGVVILVEKNAHVGTLKPDGTLETPDGKVGKLEADGTITFDGQALPLAIGDDASILLGDQVAASIDDSGNVASQNAGPKQLRWEGADTPELKRHAMFLVVLLTAPQQSGDAGSAPAPEVKSDGGARKMKGAGGDDKSDEEPEEEGQQ